MAQANPLALNSNTKKLTAASAPVTAGPVSIGAWVKRATPGSFGRYYAWICAGATNAEGFMLGEDNTTNNGLGRGQTLHGSSGAGGKTTSAVQNSTWNALLSTHAGFSGAVTSYVRGANKGVTASTYTPTGLNAIVVNGRPSDSTNGNSDGFGDLAIWNRLLSDTEALFHGAGGNPRYIKGLIDYYHVNSTGATETDLVGAINLTISGSPAAASDAPTVSTYWTAANLGNQSYTQGSAITSVDLTAKFDNNGLATWTGTLNQLSSGANATTANGSGTAAREIIVSAIGSFAAGDYVSIGAGSPVLVLQVNGSTILMGSDQTWNNGDQVNRYTVSGLALSGLTVNGSNLFSGTPGAPAVGTYSNCVFRATSGAAPVSDSNLFSITVASSGAAPSFTAGPTLTTANTDGYTYGATCNQTATLHIGVYLKGSATPSVANVKAGTGTGFQFHATAALTAATPGSISATGLTLPLYDVYFVVTNGSGDSALAPSLAVFKAAPAGKQYTSLTILPITAITKANPAKVTQTAHGRSTGDYVEIFGVGGMTQVNAFFGTITKVDANNFTLDGIDSTAYTTYTSGGTATWGQSLAYNASTVLVTGDVQITDATTREDGAAVAVRPDGSISYSGPLTRQSVQADAYSVSGGALLGVATSYINNVPPNGPGRFPPAIFLPLNQAASVNLATYFSSPELDTLGMSATGLPAGLSVVTPNLVGVPTVRAITGITVTAQDLPLETSSTVLTVVAGNVDVPPLAGLDQPSIIALLAANYLTVQFGTQDDANPAGPAAAGIAIAQTPVSGTAVPNSVINVTLSSGNAPPVVTPVISVSGDVLSNQLTQAQRLDPLSPGYLSGANSWDVVDVCVMLPAHQPGQVYRFFKLPSNARVVTLEMINDANPTGSSYSIGVRQTLPKGGALPTTPQRNPIPSAVSIFNANVSLDTERARWDSVYLPAIVGTSPNKKHFILRVWELLGLIADPTDIYEVVVTARTPGIAGGNLGLRMTYVR